MSTSTGKRLYLYVVRADNTIEKVRYGSSIKYNEEIHVFHTNIEAVAFASSRKAVK